PTSSFPPVEELVVPKVNWPQFYKTKTNSHETNTPHTRTHTHTHMKLTTPHTRTHTHTHTTYVRAHTSFLIASLSFKAEIFFCINAHDKLHKPFGLCILFCFV